MTDAVLKVALPLPLPRLFDYLPAEDAPADVADIGRRVRVAFGNRQLCGVVAAVGPADAEVTVAQAARVIAIIGSSRCIGCRFGFR